MLITRQIKLCHEIKKYPLLWNITGHSHITPDKTIYTQKFAARENDFLIFVEKIETTYNDAMQRTVTRYKMSLQRNNVLKNAPVSYSNKSILARHLFNHLAMRNAKYTISMPTFNNAQR